MDDAKPENSYQPYQAYIYNGRYPIVRTVYALLNDPRRGLPWGFAHFIESYKGQLIIKKSGILPIIMDTYVIDVKVNP
jgi:phosphate transport system substrate-binding protein